MIMISTFSLIILVISMLLIMGGCAAFLHHLSFVYLEKFEDRAPTLTKEQWMNLYNHTDWR